MIAKKIKIGEISHEVTKGTTPTTLGFEYKDSGIPFIRATNLGEKYVNFKEDVLYIDQEANKALGRSVLLPGDLLISIAGTIGEVSIVPDDAPLLNCNQAVCLIRLKDTVDRNYLRHWFSSIDAKKQIQNSKVTGVISNLSLGQIKNLELALPTLAEQRRIAAILDKAESLRAKRREAIDKLDQLLQSVFVEMFGDSVTNNKKWNEEKLLGEVADICSGITKGRKTTSETKSIPYLAVSNVQDRFLKLDVVKEIDATEDEIKKYKLKKNDLLLTEGGDPDKLGRGSLWHDEIPLCIHQNHVFRVRINNEEINPIYLNWLVGSPRGKRYFLSVAKQTTGIASINLGQLKRFPLLIPPLDLQEKFVKIEEAVREKHMVEQKASLEKIDALIGSIQASYFQ